ncbi:ATP-dependent RNA helicase DBP7 [Cryptococcus wingfieldii CBS 7118]|uniref:ATP-dependent RNA helicase n=1 Tax=Cryptococcus wingfieldii CBS 7118 TaxID=1295528 RepID=A0A1E3K680_9TREE|nr:ATP-dependent RNA helicase DBP7 [Cryptococcus wingfieldii CBS 7118]ODO08650.1 ATP-dependent RNA helicase DBP7 [Cryptococcus wingfieldii CBS 7118]
MADDIELNFAPPSANSVRQAKPKKGGRWTDRLINKREARDAYRSANAKPQEAVQVAAAPALAPVAAPKPKYVPPPAPVSRPPPPRPAAPARTLSNAEAGPSRPAPRTVSSSAPRPVSKPAPKPRQSNPDVNYDRAPLPSQAQSAPQQQAPAAPKAPQIISSLFSYVDMPQVKAAEQPAPAKKLPSNAPGGDPTTFQGLGLNKLLVRHLKSKMGVEKPTGIQRNCLPYMLSSPLNPDKKAGDAGDEPLRDVLIQAQTGSGKTLAYLLPIIQTLLPLSRLSYIDRSIGTLAIILAPTRELAQQISKVVESLLHMSLASNEEDSDSDEDERPFTRWLVSGLLTGGSTRTHEKAKLRKGVPILVSTPGRLLDHLQNTMSFQCAKTMFLVLDEADRVMDLGFEETIQGIIKALEGRRRNEINIEKAMDEEGGGTMRWPFWDRGRLNVLCSATVDAKVEKLSGAALRDPVLFRSGKEEKDGKKLLDGKPDVVAEAIEQASAVVIPQEPEDKFTPPSQLSQKYVVAPTKLRLVALVALLRSLVSSASKIDVDAKGTKVIVFLSSTDAVDFHWKMLGGVQMGEQEEEAAEDSEDGSDSEEDVDSDGEPKAKKTKSKSKSKPKPKAVDEPVSLTSSLFPNTTLHRLHGSLPLRTRLASLGAFATASSQPAILFATSVASRGLDLPLVRAVVQYDLPTEGGANEYVHRVGRTARAGKGGEAWAFVGPSEEKWVPWMEAKMGSAEGKGGVNLAQVGVEDVLKKGFGGKGWEFENRATEVQNGFETWVLNSEPNAALARRAFASFVRAYSTHPLEEKRFFHPKSLHLGHLAKAFALRESPAQLAGALNAGKTKKAKAGSSASAQPGKRKRGEEGDDDEDEVKGGKELTARNETERRMYEAVRKQGRTLKSGGKLGVFAGGKGSSGGAQRGGAASGGEFHVVDTGELERLVSGRK